VKEAATVKSLSDLHGMLHPPQGDLVFYQRGDKRQQSIILCASQKEAQLILRTKEVLLCGRKTRHEQG
jgi:hypothetical protein